MDNAQVAAAEDGIDECRPIVLYLTVVINNTMFAYTLPEGPSEINEYLFVGDSAHGSNRQMVDKLRLTAIINLTKDSFADTLIKARKNPSCFLVIFSNSDVLICR
jgi:hypothetical protein